ncbi:hypothetical protein ACQEVF_56160 [Nonomuraea polychroma]|uniref:hypothetical protein n=1 Tax=Nonomuraea polychroma TaxID=46176 RepID=UPI003D8A2050
MSGALGTLDAWRDALLEAGPLRVREEAQTRQAAALRGENAAAIRQGALARSRLTTDGVLTSPPHCELLGTRQPERIDEELQAHYARAIRGFGLIA